MTVVRFKQEQMVNSSSAVLDLHVYGNKEEIAELAGKISAILCERFKAGGK